MRNGRANVFDVKLRAAGGRPASSGAPLAAHPIMPVQVARRRANSRSGSRLGRREKRRRTVNFNGELAGLCISVVLPDDLMPYVRFGIVNVVMCFECNEIYNKVNLCQNVLAIRPSLTERYSTRYRLNIDDAQKQRIRPARGTPP